MHRLPAAGHLDAARLREEAGQRLSLQGGGAALEQGPGLVVGKDHLPPQVGGHHCEALRQLGRHLVPHQTGLRVPVEEEERLPLPHPDPVDFHTVGLDVEFLSLHPHRSLHPFLYIEHSAQF